MLMILLLNSTSAQALEGATESTIEFGLPTTCTMKTDCFIQSYPDHSSYPHTQPTQTPAQDFLCGPLASKHYWATDIRVIHYDIHNAPDVLATAAGKVTGVRRNMPDRINTDIINYQIPEGKEAGNSIIIDHGNGWQTQYNHLKFGSILVTQGQMVNAGDKIAEIGSSGKTYLPKLGLAIRHNNKPIDPFAYNENGGWSCQETNRTTLWNDEANAALYYQQTGIARTGFSEKVPEAYRLRGGLPIKDIRHISPDTVIFWADFYGIKKDDIIYMRIVDPTGQMFAETEHIARSDYPQWLGYVGRKLGTGALTSGIYFAEVIVQRGQNTLIFENYRVDLQGNREQPTAPKFNN